MYTSKGYPAKWIADEVRDDIRIIYQPATGRIVTAFPDEALGAKIKAGRMMRVL